MSNLLSVLVFCWLLLSQITSVAGHLKGLGAAIDTKGARQRQHAAPFSSSLATPDTNAQGLWPPVRRRLHSDEPHHIDSSERPSLNEQLAAVALDNKVILTQTSCGYLEFALNWIAHVEALGIQNWLTIALDQKSLRYLYERFPGHVIPVSEFSHEDLVEGRPMHVYGSKAFSDLVCARPRYLQAILDLGFEVVWSDMDTAWLRNFFDFLPSGLDLAGVDDALEGDEQETRGVCTALMYLRPGYYTGRLLNMWNDMCLRVNANNQQAFNNVFNGQIRDLIKYHILPRQLYPNGQLIDRWGYKNFEAAHNGGHNPAWLHANFHMGHAAKLQFFQYHEAWKSAAQNGLPSC